MVMTKKFIHILIPISFLFSKSYAQTPTVQDCNGAISICQDTYTESTSYTGTGNYTDEINGVTSCLVNAEENSVWYTFTVQTSGIFRFTITPQDTVFPGDDYDWSLFNLTNATCAQIHNNPSLEVSCNSWGSDGGTFNGATGISTAMGGVGNSNGPGNTNGPPWNADISVTAGNRYVLVVNNCIWAGANNGYTIDFTPSEASIYDNTPPEIDSIKTSFKCGTDAISLKFSEDIICNTAQTTDFIFQGPGGPYTITNVSGTACNTGGTQEKNFTITFSPPVDEPGTYYLILSETNSGSVADHCDNLAVQDTIVFIIPDLQADFTVTPEIASLDQPECTFINTSQGASLYLWTFGDGDSSNVKDPTHSYNKSGDYYITLIVSNSYDCLDSITKKVKVIEDELSFPNVFTPNHDGVNDYFEITNIDKYLYSKLFIRDRWGKNVFEAQNYNNKWDGGNLPDGVYYYIITYHGYLKDGEKSGIITILR